MANSPSGAHANALPASPDVLYDSLAARNAAYLGRCYVAVKSTGIFCRMDCSARTPRRENCTFFTSTEQCIAAGYRACKRCKPLDSQPSNRTLAESLIARIYADPERKWTENDLIAMGHDPSHIRKIFRAQYGTSFLQMARQMRLKNGFTTMKNENKVINAQIDAGFELPSAFRAAFVDLLGQAPGNFTEKAALKADWIDTPLGAMLVLADDSHIHLLEFIGRKNLAKQVQKIAKIAPIGIGKTALMATLSEQLDQFFNGENAQFTLPLTTYGTDFEKQVWHALTQIPAGETRSYKEVAAAIGNPKAVRAVARANSMNHIALLIPCHRVIGADGSLTGYAGGLWRKEKLIQAEGIYHKSPLFG